MVEKATITNTVTGERIPVYLNPEEYTLAKTMNYAQVTAVSYTHLTLPTIYSV